MTEEYAALVKEEEQLKNRREACTAAFRDAQHAIEAFRLQATQQFIPDYDAQFTKLRATQLEAQRALGGIRHRLKRINERRDEIHRSVYERPDYLTWPIAELAKELARLANEQKRVLGALLEALARADATVVLDDAELMHRIQAQAAGSAPEIGTLQPPPRKLVRNGQS